MSAFFFLFINFANAQEVATLQISPSGDATVVAKKENKKIPTVSFLEIEEKKLSGTFYTTKNGKDLILVTTMWELDKKGKDTLILITSKANGEYDELEYKDYPKAPPGAKDQPED